MNSRKTIWSSKFIESEESKSAIADIAIKNNISEICASLIYNRGYKTANDASKFLNFDDVVMHSPLLLKDVDKAVERIQLALKNNEKIQIILQKTATNCGPFNNFYLFSFNFSG